MHWPRWLWFCRCFASLPGLGISFPVDAFPLLVTNTVYCPVAAELGITAKCGTDEPDLHTCGEHEHHSRCYAVPDNVEAV